MNLNRRSKVFFPAMFLFVFSLFPCPGSGMAQDLDVPYVPTPHRIVEAMLNVASVGPGDYVIDLGSGDGRIVIAAAQKGAYGYGVDLDPVRVKEAKTNALKANVTDKVLFIEGDLFETDISRASVITMYLLSSVNRKLKPTLFEQLRPGTRIVSFSFDMGRWKPDEHIRESGRNVYYWVIPADLKGQWEWSVNGESWSMDIKQEFQEITVVLSAGGKTLQVRDPAVKGERVSFTATDTDNGYQYAYNGRVEGDRITGTIHIQNSGNARIENWDASLSRQ